MYLVDGEDQNCWGNCFQENFEAIFRNEVEQYIHDGAQWPDNVKFESHRSWLTFEYTESVLDLSERKIELFED